MKRPLATMMRKAIRKAKVSMCLIAKTAQVSVPTLYSVINGRTPTYSKLEDICEALNLSMVGFTEAWHAQHEADKRMRSGPVKVQADKLPKDERALLSRYRKLPKAHKRIVMGMLGLIIGKS